MVQVCRCDRCLDQSVSGKLLCTKYLRNDLFKTLDAYNRCLGCDFRDVLFKNGPELRDFSSPRSLREALRETDLAKYINKYSAHYLHDVWGHLWNYFSEPDFYINRFCGGWGFNLKEWTREQIMNMKQSRYMDLNILCYRVYVHRCSRHLTNNELDIAEKVFRDIFL